MKPPPLSSRPRRILFLCTANYYRSRFAEMLFNARACRRRLPCRARSRGIATDLGLDNPGPISPHVLHGLRARNIHVPSRPRYPRQLQEYDLIRADLVIALDETEHRPLLAERFPAWPARIRYWQVADLHCQPAENALPQMEQAVDSLLQQLSRFEDWLPKLVSESPHDRLH
jgi:protein-tyrosine phosphatase